MIEKQSATKALHAARLSGSSGPVLSPGVARILRSRFLVGSIALLLFLLVFLAWTGAWKLNLYSPISYWGDPLEMASYLGRDYVFNDVLERLSAPFGISHASPLRYVTNALFQPNSILFQITYGITHDTIAALNLYYLATFPLIFLSAYWVNGRLKLANPARFVAATLYALMPFHFQRNVGHLMESSYFLVPIFAYVLILTFAARPFFHAYVDGAWRLTWNRGRDWGFLLVLALLSAISEYHQFFFLLLFGIATLVSYVRHRNPRILLGAIILLAGLGFSIGGRVIVNHLLVEPGLRLSVIGTPISTYGEAERYGLKMVQILLPLREHPLALFRTIRSTYDAAHEVNENSTVALGLFGTIGFVFLMIRGVLAMIRRAPQVRILDVASVLNLSCVVIGTVGGIASVIATTGVVLFGPEFILAQVRCYNRLIVFIAFFSFYAASLLVLRLVSRISCYVKNTGISRAVTGVVWLSVFGFALWDQVPFKLVASADGAVRHASDKSFFGRIESQLPARSMLFQYPYNLHHASLSNSGTPPYNYADGLRPYLNSRTLRFTYGGDAGSVQANWLKETSALPPDQMIRRLCEYGFAGIIVHRKLFRDPELASAFESQLRAAMNVTPDDSSDRDFAFFPLTQFCVENRITRRDLEEERNRLLNPAEIKTAQQTFQFLSTVRVVPSPTAPHLIGVFDSGMTALVARKDEKGWLMYGPNVKLASGAYQAVFTITAEAPIPGIEAGLVDVTRSISPSQVSEVVSVALKSAAREQQIAVKFHVTPSDLSSYQFRVFVNGAAERLAISGVAVDKISD